MRWMLTLLACAALLAACGSDDDSDDGAEAPPGTGPTATFRSERIGFTFDYPREFVAQKRPRRQVLAQVSPGRSARLNAIKVRRTADRELPPERYLSAFEKDFAGEAESVEAREGQVGTLDVGVLEVRDTLERRGQEVEVTSTSYFFAGGGRTWQVECVADEEHRDSIGAACRLVLETVEFTDTD